jgi:hypothetical protein
MAGHMSIRAGVSYKTRDAGNGSAAVEKVESKAKCVQMGKASNGLRNERDLVDLCIKNLGVS